MAEVRRSLRLLAPATRVQKREDRVLCETLDTFPKTGVLAGGRDPRTRR